MLAVAQPTIIEVVAVDVDSGAFRFLASVLFFRHEKTASGAVFSS